MRGFLFARIRGHKQSMRGLYIELPNMFIFTIELHIMRNNGKPISIFKQLPMRDNMPWLYISELDNKLMYTMLDSMLEMYFIIYLYNMC